MAVPDANNLLTTTIYDARGPIASEDMLGRRTTMIYDALGRQIATATNLGFRTTTVYDKAGQSVASVDELGFRIGPLDTSVLGNLPDDSSC